MRELDKTALKAAEAAWADVPIGDGVAEAIRAYLSSLPADAGAVEALKAARKTMCNCRGAIESNQMEEKEVRRQLTRGIEAIDATLATPPAVDAGVREALANIADVMAAHQKRAETVYDLNFKAREAIRRQLKPDSPEWMREAFDALHSVHYALGGDPFNLHMEAILAALRSASSPVEPGGWRSIDSAPKDGTEFLAALSNGWVEILSGNEGIREDWRYQWWTARGRTSIPYEPSHPATTDWGKTHTIRATHWMPLPPAPAGKATDLCPECGRPKARDVHDAARGFCPKWWAVRDEDADRDCAAHAPAGKE